MAYNGSITLGRYASAVLIKTGALTEVFVDTISSIEIGVKAYPNPLGNTTTIRITGGVAGEYKLLLVDASGKIIWRRSGIKNVGDSQQLLNSTALIRGIYFLKMIQNNASSAIKLVK